MKKITLAIATIGAIFGGLSAVDAKSIEVDLRTVDQNTYIVGERIYELNEYPLSMYDIVVAATEYANAHNGEEAPIYYYYGTSYEDGKLMKFTGGLDENGTQINEVKSVKDVFADGKMVASYKNNVPLYSDEMLTQDFDKAKDIILKDHASKIDPKDGFKSIAYDTASNTVEFKIANPSVLLADYASSVLTIFAEFAGQEAVSATYSVNDGEPSSPIVFAENTDIVAIAADLLAKMANKPADFTDFGSLTVGDVAGSKATAIFTFLVDDTLIEIPYSVEFSFDKDAFIADYEAVKDAVLEEIAAEIDRGEGFESIVYDTETNTATFKIIKDDVELINYAEDVLNLFAEFAGPDAISATYRVNEGDSSDVIVLAEANLLQIAADLLAKMAGKPEDFTEFTSLTVGDVKGSRATATFTFLVSGVEMQIDYTVEFV